MLSLCAPCDGWVAASACAARACCRTFSALPCRHSTACAEGKASQCSRSRCASCMCPCCQALADWGTVLMLASLRGASNSHVSVSNGWLPLDRHCTCQMYAACACSELLLAWQTVDLAGAAACSSSRDGIEAQTHANELIQRVFSAMCNTAEMIAAMACHEANRMLTAGVDCSCRCAASHAASINNAEWARTAIARKNTVICLQSYGSNIVGLALTAGVLPSCLQC